MNISVAVLLCLPSTCRRKSRISSQDVQMSKSDFIGQNNKTKISADHLAITLSSFFSTCITNERTVECFTHIIVLPGDWCNKVAEVKQTL